MMRPETTGDSKHMASQPISTGRRPAGGARWKVALRRSVRRASEMGAALMLFAATLFLALALATYQQTDPSASTASGGAVLNWMGAPGAYAADMALLLFGPVAVLLLPLLFISGRKLWRLARDGDGDDYTAPHSWWHGLFVLLAAMLLLSTVLGLLPAGTGTSFPATVGGLAGIMGAKLLRAAASLLPAGGQSWAIFAMAIASAAGGAILAGRVFAIDWAGLFAMPRGLVSAPDMLRGSSLSLPKLMKTRTDRLTAEPLAATPARRAPEISDPSRTIKPAQLSGKSRQGDLFDNYELPGLELLADPPRQAAPKLDKLALEKNARLLETVLDDFNVKGEITAVRTGPVVTMYELEPAPGIKASRVMGLADDIARNMSAISARVSSIPEIGRAHV